MERYAPEKGAVAIVLDCSGSMIQSDLLKSKRPYNGKVYTDAEGLRKDYNSETPCDYHDATDALAQFLKTMPAGTNLSVFVFGQKLPGATSVLN